MKIHDDLYGDFEINEDVLIDLINCNAVQRLKGISQFGIPDEYYFKKGFSRYEHSVGVMILLRKAGAGLEEQIAGLLHDISHTAFSHVADWLFGSHDNEDYQDNVHVEMLEKSDAPQILENHGFDYRKIADIKRFSLLEREASYLCADRADYALREIKDFEKEQNFKLILESLVAVNGKLLFNSKKAAEIFSRGFAACQKEHWASNEAKARYHILAEVLKKGLDKRAIYLDDLNKTDSEVIDILLGSGDESIISGLGLLRKGFELRESDGINAIRLMKKFRYIDPEVLVDGKIVRLSEISKEYCLDLDRQRQEALLPAYVEVIPR